MLRKELKSNQERKKKIVIRDADVIQRLSVSKGIPALNLEDVTGNKQNLYVLHSYRGNNFPRNSRSKIGIDWQYFIHKEIHEISKSR